MPDGTVDLLFRSCARTRAFCRDVAGKKNSPN